LRVIPVLDIKAGSVVRARRGDRANYRPIDSPLIPGTSDPIEVAKALLVACSTFDSLYVADLDGIEGGDRDRATVLALAAALPGVRILVDDGSRCAEDLSGLLCCPALTPVIGSETLRMDRDLAEIADAARGEFALSLDWRGAQRLGPPSLFDDSSLWPSTVIVMTLDRVGAKTGPDLQRVRHVKAIAGPRGVLAAGGVRTLEDLGRLKALDCGALIATALHDMALPAKELEDLLTT
jgi:HisA/HisF family protein